MEPILPDQPEAAQARYQAAKTYYQGVLADASSGGTTSGSTIFTTQVPSAFENDGTYELGTRFYADVNGQITQVRLYTSAQEGGSHNVRIWRVTDGALMAGPYTWNITSGAEGWQNFVLPTALNITANTDYVVAISTSSDRWYAEDVQGSPRYLNRPFTHVCRQRGIHSVTRDYAVLYLAELKLFPGCCIRGAVSRFSQRADLQDLFR